MTTLRHTTRISDQSLFLASADDRARRRAQRGVTLLEALITVAMTAVALTISVPGFQALRGPHQVTTAAHQVVAVVEAARFRAIARNVRYRVTFVAPSTYRVERET